MKFELVVKQRFRSYQITGNVKSQSFLEELLKELEVKLRAL